MVENKNKQEIMDVLQGEDTVKSIKFLQLRWYGHVEVMQNQSMPKQIAVAAMEGTRKRGIPRKRWRGEVEEDLGIRGNKKQTGNGQRLSGMEEDVLGARVHSGLWCLRSRRRKTLSFMFICNAW
jgi:hypothetical protein